MTRKKVKLAFIDNNASRKATYKKRKRGLLKKVHEISTLCGINAGAIIYSPYDPTPEVWPSVAGMNQMIDAFRNLPEIDRHKNMVNQREFIQQRINKAENLLLKQKKDNREVNLTEAMYQSLQMGELVIQARGSSDPAIARDLNDLGYLVDQFINSLIRRILILEGGSDVEIGESSNAAAAMAQDPSEPVRTLALVEGATAPATTVHGQQFYQPYAPYSLGFYEQARNQDQSMEMMNRPMHMGYAANQMGFPFMDNTHHYHHKPHWFLGDTSTAPQQQQLFPGDSSTAPQPQQLFPGESSAAPPPATSGSDPSAATTPNPTNNIWFR
ncbi:Agamous-like MADS-box protein AGL80 [Raphanus sativus]|nr:Agamous-like MADS-box protein AGL80 [Raphanus sativus]